MDRETEPHSRAPQRGHEEVASEPDTQSPATSGADEIPEEVKLRGLPWHLANTTLNTVFTTLTVFGSVFLLFLDALGLPKAQIGMLLSLMPFAGLLALGFAPVATRLGRRRVFLTCWTARKLAVAGLLLLPLVLSRFGDTAGLVYLTTIVALFAVLRSLGETAWYPWYQEVVPNRLRGRFSAKSTVLSTLATCAALLAAGQVLKGGATLDRFMLLIGVGCIIGLVGVLMMLPVPGGRPRPEGASRGQNLANLRNALGDRNLVNYLAGLACVTVGTMLYLSFLPLFLKERLGMAPATVVSLETVVMIGGALSAILWGRASDRVGSRPVLMTATTLTMLIPLGWLLLPREIPNILIWCGLLYFTHGVLFNGGYIGSFRLLFNGVTPPRHNTAYTALYYAALGLTGGAAPLLAGGLLQLYGSRHIDFGPLTADGHTVLFVLSMVLLALGLACYARVQPDDRYRTREVFHILAGRLVRRFSR